MVDTGQSSPQPGSCEVSVFVGVSAGTLAEEQLAAEPSPSPACCLRNSSDRQEGFLSIQPQDKVHGFRQGMSYSNLLEESQLKSRP